MKVSREEAGANRERIIEVASRLFREKGLDGIGVADLMKGAGLTHGGFYGHFKSKDDLAAHAAERALQRSNARWAELIEKSKGDSFAVVTKGYLSEEHRDKLGSGCAFAALGADAARQGRTFRQVFTDGLNAATGILAGVVSGRSKADRRKHALAAMSQMVGALVLSRAVDDRDLANEILRAALDDLVGRNAAGSDV
jgi:TetR/AcrR family transcriptional repressor of nem operon